MVVEHEENQAAYRFSNNHLNGDIYTLSISLFALLKIYKSAILRAIIFLRGKIESRSNNFDLVFRPNFRLSKNVKAPISQSFSFFQIGLV